MPVGLSLLEYAALVAPRPYRLWRATWDIVTGKRPSLASRQKRIDSAVEPHRRALLQRNSIDPRTMLSARPVAGSFGQLLTVHPTREEREREIAFRAAAHARDEVIATIRTHYERRSHRLHVCLAKYLCDTISGADVRVTATLDGRTRRHLARIELRGAKIDLHRETVSVGHTTWKMVEIEAPTRPLKEARGTDLVHTPVPDLQERFDAEKRRRLEAGENHRRDAMTMWARKRLEVPSDVALTPWRKRSDEFSRDGGRSKSRGKLRRKSGTG